MGTEYHHLALEIIRWGYANIPGSILYYSKDLDIDMEELGIICAVFYACEQSRPLSDSGVRVGDVLRCCSSLSVNKLSRRLNRMQQRGLLAIEDSKGHIFTERIIDPLPLLRRLQELIARDHPLFKVKGEAEVEVEAAAAKEELLEPWRQQVARLEAQLAEYREKNQESIALPEIPMSTLGGSDKVNAHSNGNGNGNSNSHSNGSSNGTSYSSEAFRRVAEFISRKTGNLLSTKMEIELKKWLYEFNHTPEFLLCMLELSFEREIVAPGELNKIARGLKECGISSVEGLQLYFNNQVDLAQNPKFRQRDFDPEIIEFGAFTGIDMNAEARKLLYYKWRYDWGFTHVMIMKAGELMCRRTRNGGLEYIDSVLNNWLSNEIRTPEEADKQIKEHKNRNKTTREKSFGREAPGTDYSALEHEIFVPPDLLEELKSKTKD